MLSKSIIHWEFSYCTGKLVQYIPFVKWSNLAKVKFSKEVPKEAQGATKEKGPILAKVPPIQGMFNGSLLHII